MRAIGPLVFMDTSFIIAVLNRDDRYHYAARFFVGAVENRKARIITTTAVLIEAGDGFCKPPLWARFKPFLDALTSDPMVEIVQVSRQMLEDAIALRARREDKGWGLTDCIGFGVMTQQHIREALTSDAHFQQAGFRSLLLEAPPNVEQLFLGAAPRR